MSVVAELAGVSIVRGEATLLDGVDWRIDEADRWVIIGPNGAGKTTMLQILTAQMHPSSGLAEVLGEVLGSVDVFELRPRIGVASAALADRIPRSERVADVVISAAYAVMGRWRENYELADLERAVELGHLSLRGADRVQRVAWSLADLASRERPNRDDVGRAMTLRMRSHHG